MKSTTSHLAAASSPSSSSRLQLACLAASPGAIRAAVDAGADWVRLPYRRAQLSLPVAGDERISKAVRYVHGRGRRISLDLNVSMQELRWTNCREAVAWATAQGFDAIVLSDAALALYCTTHFPGLPLHFIAHPSVCAKTAMRLKLQLNAARLIVTPGLSVAQLVEISTRTSVEVEILACDTIHMSGTEGVLPGFPFAEDAENPCNDSCYSSKGNLTMAMQRLPLLASLGIRAIEVEPRNDLPDEVAKTARLWRSAIDHCLDDRDRNEAASVCRQDLSLRRVR